MTRSLDQIQALSPNQVQVQDPTLTQKAASPVAVDQDQDQALAVALIQTVTKRRRRKRAK